MLFLLLGFLTIFDVRTFIFYIIYLSSIVLLDYTLAFVKLEVYHKPPLYLTECRGKSLHTPYPP